MKRCFEGCPDSRGLSSESSLKALFQDCFRASLHTRRPSILQAPEHCEGTVTTSDDGQHLCTNSIALNITVGGVTGDDEHDDEEYEHSEASSLKSVEIFLTKSSDCPISELRSVRR